MALNYPHCSPSSEVRKPKQKWVVPGHILNRNTHSLQRELGPSEYKTFLFLFPLEVLFSALVLYSFFPTTKLPSSSILTFYNLFISSSPLPTGLMHSACFLPVLLALPLHPDNSSAWLRLSPRSTVCSQEWFTSLLPLGISIFTHPDPLWERLFSDQTFAFHTHTALQPRPLNLLAPLNWKAIFSFFFC